MTEKILIVDDEESNLRQFTHLLIPMGYDIQFALSALRFN